ncbi:hypothetical protein CDL15_Pgr004216 [Punica granatum]|uniref:Uncharacterized protein n=1 Tax=Punica granatum TaxID=22663 RepID=A0A218XEZ5_PUNGR|nr:hypothetical protein CDL15_Pgr004216 [Punica granatum]
MTAEEERATQPSLQPGPFVEEQVTQMEHVVRRIPAYMEMCFKGIEDMLRFHGMSSNLDMSQHHVMPTWSEFEQANCARQAVVVEQQQPSPDDMAE